jgi:hypothetical protein
MLKMIEAGVEGVYVVHAGEEIGCVGSSALVKDNPEWIDHVDFAISFDRKGYTSIITHQLGMRTCSDAFANSFADMMDFNFEIDTSGAYTDSNEYTSVIAECTNISVGYFNQHSAKETQDKVFLDMLIEKLIAADWSKLVAERDVNEIDTIWGNDWTNYRDIGKRAWESDWDYDPLEDGVEEVGDTTVDFMVDIIKENPVAIAMMLKDLGYDAYDLYDEVQDYDADIKPGRGFRKK